MAKPKIAIKKLLRPLSWIVIALILYFFASALHRNLDSIRDVSIDISFLTVAGILLMTLAVVVSGILWARIVDSLEPDKRVPYRDGVRIHAASWILKYIPGQVGSLINKLAWGHKNGFSKRVISASFIYENTLTVFASIIIGTPAIILFRDQLGEGVTVLAPLLILIPLLVVLNRSAFYWLLSKTFRLLRRKPFSKDQLLSGGQLIKHQMEYLVPRILNAVGFAFIVPSVVSVEPYMLVGLGATFVLASVIGLLAFFIPGGIGVREAVIVFFASAYVPVEQAILLSLVARVYSTVADVGVGLVYLALNKGRIQQQ